MALRKRTRAYNTPDDRAAIEETPEQSLETIGAPIEVDVKDPVAETKLLREMLAQQQQALRKSIQSALESEKSAEVANAKLIETQDQLRATERELAQQRVQLQRTSDSAASASAGLVRELNAREQALQKLQSLRDWDRRVLAALVVGFLLLGGLAYVVLTYHPPPLPVTAVRLAPSRQGLKPGMTPHVAASDAEDAALDRLNQVLAVIGQSRIPAALAAANRALVASGDPPCSIAWMSGERAVLLASNRPGKAPLVSALNRCAGVLERLATERSF